MLDTASSIWSNDEVPAIAFPLRHGLTYPFMRVYHDQV